jgi:hypothetical protein
MVDTYRGNATNITAPPAAVNIFSSTNTDPIVVTTSTNHGLESGDPAVIAGHTTNTSANGIWPEVTVLSTSTFSIPVAGVGVGGATGTVQPLDLGTIDIPEDGVDQMDATSVNVPFEGGFDRDLFEWLYMYFGFGRLPVALPDADTTVSYTTDSYQVPDVVTLRTFDLPSPVLPAPFTGRRVRFRFTRLLVTGNSARIRYSATILATLPGGGGAGDEGWVEVETDAAGTGYVVSAWGGTAQL